MEYWKIYRAVSEILHNYGLTCADSLISRCVERVQQDADAEWNEDDVRIAIRNELNNIIENMKEEN